MEAVLMSTNQSNGSSMNESEESSSALKLFSEQYGRIHGYIAAVVCIWGIIANIANIVVLTRKNLVSSTNAILTWLAVADLLTMSSYFPVSLHFYIMRDPDLQFPMTRSLHWCRFMLFHINFTVLCHTIAIWLTIVLAIFRYLYICYPSMGMTMCSMYRAKIAILAVYMSTAIICIPNYMATTITHDNDTIHSLDATGPLINDINFWVQAMLIKLIPCGLLTILTILLIHAMRKANKRRMKLKSQGKKDESDRAREHNRTTAMLLAVVGLFLLTELPQGILTLCNTFITDFFNDIYWYLGDLIDIAALLNNSVNFVLYCSMSRQFRDTFVQIFCSCCPQRPGWLKVKAVHIQPNSNNTKGTQCASIGSTEV